MTRSIPHEICHVLTHQIESIWISTHAHTSVANLAARRSEASPTPAGYCGTLAKSTDSTAGPKPLVSVLTKTASGALVLASPAKRISMSISGGYTGVWGSSRARTTLLLRSNLLASCPLSEFRIPLGSGEGTSTNISKRRTRARKLCQAPRAWNSERRSKNSDNSSP